MSVVQPTTSDLDVDLRQLFASLVANWVRILVVACGVALAAFVLASLATPHYKAETRLLIETRESVFTRPQGDAESDKPLLDEEGVTSQVEVISSTDILKQVARKLDLAKLPEFDEAADMSIVGRLLVIAGLKSDPNEIPPEERVLKSLREKLSIYRVERSRVIVIEASSEDPALAAAIPNAIADAYLTVARDAKRQSNADATDWLEPEIATLTKKVKDAEARVAAFRAEADMPVGQNNSTLATQQLSELSSELSKVRASRSAAEANVQSVRAALASGGSLEAFPDVLSSGLIQRLREKQVQLQADIADLSTSLLDNHPRIRALRSQLADLDRQIQAEGKTILNGLTNEAAAAKLRESQLVASLNTLKAESARVSEKEVELRALEREAAAQRELLESYLTRFREAASRRDGNYLPADARIFSRAITPSEAYFPKIIPIVGAAFAGTLLVMAIATLLSELFSGAAMRPATRARGEDVELVRMPELAAMPGHEDFAPLRAPIPGAVSVDKAAQSLMSGGVSRLLFVSPEGDEAAASAVLVARAVADAGLRVLLVDLTASGAASLPMLDGVRQPGITNLLAGESQFADVIHGDQFSDCHVMPSGTADAVKAMRAADRIPIIMQSLTTAYDLVIVECGAANAAALRRLAVEGTEIMVSVMDEQDAAAAACEELVRGGFARPTLVSPGDGDLTGSPVQTRDAA